MSRTACEFSKGEPAGDAGPVTQTGRHNETILVVFG